MLSLYAVSVTQIPSRNNIIKFFCECTWHAAQAVEMEILKQGLNVLDARTKLLKQSGLLETGW